MENSGFDGDFSNLAEKLPNQSLDSLHFMTQYEAKRKAKEQKKTNGEETLNTLIEKLRRMEVNLFENLPLNFQLQSLM